MFGEVAFSTKQHLSGITHRNGEFCIYSIKLRLLEKSKDVLSLHSPFAFMMIVMLIMCISLNISITLKLHVDVVGRQKTDINV